MSLHIAFIKPPTVAKLMSGGKQIESRLSVARHPARHTQPGDTILFKCRHGLLVATVTNVDVYSDLTADDIATLETLYWPLVNVEPNPAYWAMKQRSRHAVFIWVRHARQVLIPHELLPSTQLGWVHNYQPPAAVARLLGTDC